MSVRLYTRAEAVKVLGLKAPRDLDRLVDRGAPGVRPGARGSKRYDCAAIDAWRKARQARLQPTLDLQTERAGLARAQRQFTELKLREMKGELIRAKDAIRVQVAIVTAARAALLSVPRRCVLAGVDRKLEPVIKKLIGDALRELSEAHTLDALEQADGGDE